MAEVEVPETVPETETENFDFTKKKKKKAKTLPEGLEQELDPEDLRASMYILTIILTTSTCFKVTHMGNY